MAKNIFISLSPEVLFEFDQEVSQVSVDNGVVSDFYASGEGGETKHLARNYRDDAQALTLREAAPAHIRELLDHEIQDLKLGGN